MQIRGLFVLLNQNLAEYGSQESVFNKLLEQLLSALHVDSHPLCHAWGIPTCILHQRLGYLVSALLMDT